MELCNETIFQHVCLDGFYCLECRVILQICLEEYSKLTEKLRERIYEFSLKITKEMEMNMR